MPSDSSRQRGSGARYDSDAVVATTLTRQPAFASISQVVRSEIAAPLAVSIGDCGMSNSKLRSCIPGLYVERASSRQRRLSSRRVFFCSERRARSKVVIVAFGDERSVPVVGRV